MKYLKRFNESKVDDLTYDITDICLDLVEDGFKVNTFVQVGGDYFHTRYSDIYDGDEDKFDKYKVIISTQLPSQFSLYDVQEEVAQIVDYTESKGYKYSIDVSGKSIKIDEFMELAKPFPSGGKLNTREVSINIYPIF